MNEHALPEVFNNIIKYPSGGANIFTCSDVKRVDNISLHNEKKENGIRRSFIVLLACNVSLSFFRQFCCVVVEVSLISLSSVWWSGRSFDRVLLRSFIMMCIELATCKYKLGSHGEKVLEIGRSLSEAKLVESTDR